MKLDVWNKIKYPPFTFPSCVWLKSTDQEMLKQESYYTECNKLISIILLIRLLKWLSDRGELQKKIPFF